MLTTDLPVPDMLRVCDHAIIGRDTTIGTVSVRLYRTPAGYEQCERVGRITIGDHATIGELAVLGDQVIIGKHAVVTSNTLASSDLLAPANCVFEGVPGKVRPFDARLVNLTQTVVTRANPSLEDDIHQLLQTLNFEPDSHTSVSGIVVVLTGATGNLGRFLLLELLWQTSMQVCCLARGKSDKHARDRVIGALSDADIALSPAQIGRVTVLASDLARGSTLGLAADVYASLASDACMVIHCAAKVNHVVPYAALRRDNGEATRNLLRFSMLVHPKPFHFISTIAALTPDMAKPSGAMDEVTPIGDFDTIPDSGACIDLHGYGKSKYVSEELVRRSGVPFAIYRCTQILGHAHSGYCNTEDWPCRAMMQFARTGCKPTMSLEMHGPSVDFVASSIIRIARCPLNLGKTYLVSHDDALFTMDDLGEAVEFICGIKLKPQSFTKWREVSSQNPDDPLSIHSRIFPSESTQSKLSHQQFDAALYNAVCAAPESSNYTSRAPVRSRRELPRKMAFWLYTHGHFDEILAPVNIK